MLLAVVSVPLFVLGRVAFYQFLVKVSSQTSATGWCQLSLFGKPRANNACCRLSRLADSMVIDGHIHLCFFG